MTPAAADLTEEQHAELHAVYLTFPSLHGKKFEEAIQDTATRICLWHVAQNRREERARSAANAEPFFLRPCDR